MAGRSIRFREFGIHIPKWALLVGSDPIIIWALKTAHNLKKPKEKIVLILNSEYSALLKNIMIQFSYYQVELVEIDEITEGQAMTVLKGLAKLKYDKKERLLIWCADSYIRNLESINFDSGSNHLILAKLDGSQWSFAEINGNKVTKTVEKIKISEYASVGLYSFSDIQMFLEFNFISNLSSEIYVAPLYNQLISKGYEVNFSEISPLDFFSFGTPNELIESAARLGVAPDNLISQNSG